MSLATRLGHPGRDRSNQPLITFNWPRAHWIVGTSTLLLFPLAGLYMRYVAHVPELNDAPRLMFRSRFLFLLLIATVNLALSYAKPERLVQRLASMIMLVAPLPLIVSFFVDPGRGVRGSPWTAFTMRGLFVAALLLAWAHRPRSML
jgi:hypothetical protein